MAIRRINEGEQGFTLIEAIITLVVLSIAALGVMSVFATGISGRADPAIASAASRLAREKLDTIIGDRMNPARGFSWIASSAYPSEDPVPGFPALTRSVEVTCAAASDLNVDVSCPQAYKRVVVTVTWNSGAGSVSLTTILADYP